MEWRQDARWRTKLTNGRIEIISRLRTVFPLALFTSNNFSTKLKPQSPDVHWILLTEYSSNLWFWSSESIRWSKCFPVGTTQTVTKVTSLALPSWDRLEMVSCIFLGKNSLVHDVQCHTAKFESTTSLWRILVSTRELNREALMELKAGFVF